MKKILLSLTILSFFLPSKGQNNHKIEIGQIDSLQSTFLKEKRMIWVHLPPGATQEGFAKKHYPVVYLLDGDAHFSSVVGMIEQLSTVNGNTICPEMIVVGIPNTDRTRDLTPTHVNIDPPYMDSATSKASGGGEKFLAFIEKELIPYINAKYPTEPYKMLIGHSLGGLMVMQTLVHHPNLFNAYICIDPSMWWDHQKLLKETKALLEEKKFPATTLYLGIANTMDEGMDIQQGLKDTSKMTIHIRSIFALQSYFQKYKPTGMKFQSKYYPTDSHGSAPLITEYDALHFIFDYYPTKLSLREYLDTSGSTIKKLQEHYLKVSKEIGFKQRPSEATINGMGYEALGQKQYQYAGKLFKLNVENYPESFNVYDSMGDYYSEVKDKTQAILYYEKALKIKENADTQKKLMKLKEI